MIDFETHPTAKLFASHGVEFQGQRGDELYGHSPFTGKPDKFYVNVKTWLWDDKSAGVAGGISKFLELVHQLYLRQPGRRRALKDLVAFRNMPSVMFDPWKIGWTGKRYVIPVRNDRGRFIDLRLYDAELKQMRSTPGCRVGLLGCEQIVRRPSEPIYLCEGEWDAMSLHWLLRTVKQPGIAVGVPGAGTFKPEWAELMRGRVVHTLYDADDAGDQGEMLAKKKLTGVAKSITYVEWPDEVPKGFDTRDWIYYGALRRKTPEPCFEKLVARFRKYTRREGVAQKRENDKPRAVKLRRRIRPAASLADVHACFNKWLKDANLDAVNIMLAVCMSQQLDGPPLWMFLVSPPGGAKTVTLLSLSKWAGAKIVGGLTSHTLISGSSNAANGVDPSLIPQLRDKVCVSKDFTPVLTMRDMDRDEIFGILRDAYDGTCGKTFGNGIVREYVDCRFSFLSGVTPRIHDVAEQHASLGERFLKFAMGDNLDHQNEHDIIARAIDNSDRNTAMAEELSTVVAAFLEAKWPDPPTLSEEYRSKIISLAQMGARLRGTVSKDFRGEHILGRPFAEFATRLGIQLAKLARALAWVYGKTEVGEAEYNLVCKVMLDTVSQRHEDILRALYKRSKTELGTGTTNDLAEDTRYPAATLRRLLDDLLLLKVVERKGSQYRHHWCLSPYMLEGLARSGLYTRPEHLNRVSRVRFRVRRRGAKPDPSA